MLLPIILNEDKVELANIINRLLDKNGEDVVFDYLDKTCEDIIHERDYARTITTYENKFQVVIHEYAKATHGRFVRDCMSMEQFKALATAVRESVESYLSVAEKRKDAEDYLARLEQATCAASDKNKDKDKDLQSINDMLRRVDH